MVSSVFSEIYAPYFPVFHLEEDSASEVIREVAQRAGQKWVSFEREWDTFLQADHPPSIEGAQQWDEETLRAKVMELLQGGEQGASSPVRVMETALAICTFVLFLLALIAFPYLAIPAFVTAIGAASCQAVLSIRAFDRERLVDSIALQGLFFARAFFQEGPHAFYEKRLEREVLFALQHPLSYLEEAQRNEVEERAKALAVQKLKAIGEAFTEDKSSDRGELALRIASSFAKGEMPDCTYEQSKREILRELQPFLAQVLSLDEAIGKGSLQESLHQSPRETLLALTRRMRTVAETSPCSIESFPSLQEALVAEGWRQIGVTGIKTGVVSFTHRSLPKLELQLFLQPSSSGNPSAFLLKAAMAEKLTQAIRDLGLQSIAVARTSLLPLVQKERLGKIDENNLPRAFAFVREKSGKEKPLSRAGQERSFWSGFARDMRGLIRATGFSCAPEALAYDEGSGKVVIVDPTPQGGELLLSNGGVGFRATGYLRRQKDAPLQYRAAVGAASLQNLLLAI